MYHNTEAEKQDCLRSIFSVMLPYLRKVIPDSDNSKFYDLHMFNICALRNIYMYVTNQQMHTDKICFIIYYYSSTCFGRFCEHYQGVTQEYKNIQQLHRMYDQNHPMFQLIS